MRKLARRFEKALLGVGSLSRRREVRAGAIGMGMLLAIMATSFGAQYVAPRELGRPVADSIGVFPSASPTQGAPLVGPQGGGKNIVQVLNNQDGRLTVSGRVQLNSIPAPGVSPVNIASAYTSCTDCQTVALALQVNLYKAGAPYFTPQNAATAVNYLCTRCVTFAIAEQWTIPVDDPTNPPADVRALVRDMNSQLDGMRSRQTTAYEAETAINNVIAQYGELVGDLTTKISRATDSTTPGATASPPAPSPTPASPSPAATGVSPTPTSSPTQTQPTPSPSPSDSPTPGPSP